MVPILFAMIGYFNGHDKTVWVMIQGLVQTLLVRLPFAYVMSIQPNSSLTHIGFAAPASSLVGILLNVGFYLWMNRRKKGIAGKIDNCNLPNPKTSIPIHPKHPRDRWDGCLM